MISTGKRNPLYDGAPVPTIPAPSTLHADDPPIIPVTRPPPKLTMPLGVTELFWLVGSRAAFFRAEAC